MIDSRNHMDSVVVACTISDKGDTNFIGRAVAFADHPTVVIETQPGEQSHWAQHLCRPATHEEEVAYWRQRAEAAERGKAVPAADPGDVLQPGRLFTDNESRAARLALLHTPSIYEQRLRAVLDVVRRYLPPDGIAVDLAMSEIIGLVDPWLTAEQALEASNA